MRAIGCLTLILIVALAGGFLAFRWFGQRDHESPLTTFKKPHIDLYGFFIKSISFEKTIADVQLMIDNTAPVALEADSLQYDVLVEGTEITRGSYTLPIRLKASDTTLVTLTVTLDNQKLFTAMRNMEGQHPDSLVYTLKAKVFTDLPFMKNKPINVEFSRKMPMGIIPDVRLLEEQLRKLGHRKDKHMRNKQLATG